MNYHLLYNEYYLFIYKISVVSFELGFGPY